VTHIPLGRACRSAALVCGVITAIAPAAALANSYTVDDDRQDCPNAAFSSIQAAVDQAAPHDTIIVCPGVYRETSTPVNHAGDPALPGSRNGLTINKPLTIVGAGADKVTIEPVGGIQPRTLAGPTAVLRDGGGNVITIGRQSLGSTDADENRVDISGVTVASPDTHVEAGIAFFNASGSISNSVVGPLASPTQAGYRAGTTLPYGWGIVASDGLRGTGPGNGGPRREVTVANTLVTGYQAGGILFDDAFSSGDDATATTRSQMIQHGIVDGTRVVGDGTTAGQVGIEYRAGEQGSISDSEVTGNLGTGVLLADADTRPSDPDNPAVPSFWMDGTSLTANGAGLVNAAIDETTVNPGDPALATGDDGAGANWFGCASGPAVLPAAPSDGCQPVSGANADGDPSVVFNALTAAPAPLALPVTTADNPPSLAIVDPLDGSTVTAGTPVDPVVVPTDDFGVKAVSLAVDGAPLATINHAPYEFTWTPSAEQVGRTLALTATATDSDGHTVSSTVNVTVAAAPGGGGDDGGDRGSDGGGDSNPAGGGQPGPGPSTDTPPPPSTQTVTRTVVVEKTATAVLSLVRSVKGGAKLALGSFKLVNAGAKGATVTLSGRLKVGKRAYRVSGRARGTRGKLTLKLGAKAAKALKRQRGTLKLTVSVRGPGGKRSTVSSTIAVRRG
jgi:hypothetical protein